MHVSKKLVFISLLFAFGLKQSQPTLKAAFLSPLEERRKSTSIGIIKNIQKFIEKHLSIEEIGLFLQAKGLDKELANATLKVAIEQNLITVARVLLAMNIDLSPVFMACNFYKTTPLHICLRKGNADFFQEIIAWAQMHLTKQQIFNLLNTRDIWEATLLHWAVASGNIPAVKKIIECAHAHLDSEQILKIIKAHDGYNGTPLFWAQDSNNFELAELLIQAITFYEAKILEHNKLIQ